MVKYMPAILLVSSRLGLSRAASRVSMVREDVLHTTTYVHTIHIEIYQLAPGQPGGGRFYSSLEARPGRSSPFAPMRCEASGRAVRANSFSLFLSLSFPFAFTFSFTLSISFPSLPFSFRFLLLAFLSLPFSSHFFLVTKTHADCGCGGTGRKCGWHPDHMWEKVDAINQPRQTPEVLADPDKLAAPPDSLADFKQLGHPGFVANALLQQFCYVNDVAVHMPSSAYTAAVGVSFASTGAALSRPTTLSTGSGVSTCTFHSRSLLRFASYTSAGPRGDPGQLPPLSYG